MRSLVLAPVCAALALASPAQEPAARRPDVLLIVLDDVNDWVGYLGGHPGARTPEIDRLAARGLAFTNAHCPAPVCRPSRTAMLSGARPSTTLGGPDDPWQEVLGERATLPAHFGAHGYRLLGCGKVFHHDDELAFEEYFEGSDTFPRLQGEALGVFGLESDGAPEKFNELSTDIRNDGSFDWAAIDADEECWRDYQRAGWAAARLLEDGDQPLFLALGLGLPHLPWYVPEPYFELHPRESIELPEVRAGDKSDLPAEARALVRSDRVHAKLVEADLWRDALQAYLAALSFADAQVGRVLAALDQSPRRDRTIVVLVSDHGWHLGEKGHWRKATLWEPSTHIPLVIAAPGRPTAGATCARPVDSLSIYATLCELAGLPTPEHVEGPSLVPLLDDAEAEWPHLALTTYRNFNHSVRSERFRFTRYRGGGVELYDLERDPGEFDNRADDPELADERRRLGRQLDRLLVPPGR